jgi:hypothetical protein
MSRRHWAAGAANLVEPTCEAAVKAWATHQTRWMEVLLEKTHFLLALLGVSYLVNVLLPENSTCVFKSESTS